MRQAAAFTDGGVRAGCAAIAPGVRDSSRRPPPWSDAMYRAGSDPVCWGPVVAAGYRAGLAHSSFNGHVIARGETVFLELTGQHRRYVAPVMRTAIVGPATAEHRRLAQASADAVAAILETARAGTPARTVAEAGLRHIRPVERDVVFHYYFGYPVGIGYPPSWIETLGFFIRTDNPAPLQSGHGVPPADVPPGGRTPRDLPEPDNAGHAGRRRASDRHAGPAHRDRGLRDWFRRGPRGGDK